MVIEFQLLHQCYPVEVAYTVFRAVAWLSCFLLLLVVALTPMDLAASDAALASVSDWLLLDYPTVFLFMTCMEVTPTPFLVPFLIHGLGKAFCAMVLVRWMEMDIPFAFSSWSAMDQETRRVHGYWEHRASSSSKRNGTCGELSRSRFQFLVFFRSKILESDKIFCRSSFSRLFISMESSGISITFSIKMYVMRRIRIRTGISGIGISGAKRHSKCEMQSIVHFSLAGIQAKCFD